MEISTTRSNNRRVSRDLVEMIEQCGATPRVRPPWCRQRVALFNEEPSMTQQAHLDQTDVNAIVKRFHRTGVLPEGRGTPQYGDVTGLQGDLTELYNQANQRIETAQEFVRGYKEPEEPIQKPKKGKETPPEQKQQEDKGTEVPDT